MNKFRQSLPGDAQHPRRLSDTHAQRDQHIVQKNHARVHRSTPRFHFYPHHLMIIPVVHDKGVPAFKPEGYTPVRGHRNRPNIGFLPFEFVKPETRKIHIPHRRARIQTVEDSGILSACSGVIPRFEPETKNCSNPLCL